jgi:hypothetical protein
MEVFFCESCALSATRIYVQDERQIMTDPCDNRLIRFNNLMQLLKCICDIAAAINRDFALAAQIVDLIAAIFYCFTQAMMQAQTDHELKLHPTAADYGDGSGSDRTSLLKTTVTTTTAPGFAAPPPYPPGPAVYPPPGTYPPQGYNQQSPPFAAPGGQSYA